MGKTFFTHKPNDLCSARIIFALYGALEFVDDAFLFHEREGEKAWVAGVEGLLSPASLLFEQ